MKISATRLPLAIALSSALAFAVGCAADRDADATADVDMTPPAAEADQTATPPVGPTTAEPAMDATADAGMDASAGPGDGMDSDQPVDDTWITTKVKSSLLADSEVSGLDINVDTLNGTVTLRGDVESQAQIDAATRIAQGIEGVTNVDASGLTVNPAE